MTDMNLSAEIPCDWFQEISEADSRTAYQLTRRIWEGSTAFCDEVLIAESPVYGRMLFLDGELQSASADEHVYHETLVHPAMAAHGAPARVLVVGGGEGATVREVLRWPTVQRVDWVDIDGQLVDLCREFLGWAPTVYDDPRVRYRAQDIGEALPTLGSYDVIIVDLPDPDGGFPYLYTSLFWEDMRMHLEPNGHLVSHVGPVRPFGNVGEGWQRVRWAFGSSEAARGCFYTSCIPSFQGDWGFWTWGAQGSATSFEFAPWLPADLRLVDYAQLHRWAEGSLLWRSALSAAETLCIPKKETVESTVLEEEVEKSELST
jgi:spermidine synthase